MNTPLAAGTIALMELWFKFADWVFSKTVLFPKKFRFTLASRIDNLMLDGIEKIIEAKFNINRVSNLQDLNILIEKLRFLFRLAYKRKNISVKDYEFAALKLNESGRMIGAWLKAIKK